MTKLIVNADDFGHGEGVNRGIIYCLEEGVVTSTTLMMNSQFTENAVKLAKEKSLTCVGIHLVLTAGKPLLGDQVPSLIDSNGNFLKNDSSGLRGITLTDNVLEEIRQEFKAQIESFLETGLPLSHIDSHHHVHDILGIQEIVVELGHTYNVPIRCNSAPLRELLQQNEIKTTDAFSHEFYGEMATIEGFKSIVQKFQQDDGNGDTLEIMCHPAFLDDVLKSKSSYYETREDERQVLTDKTLINWLEEIGVTLLNYTML